MGHTDEQRLMWLDALEAAGVDNWDGYDEARSIYKEWVDKAWAEAEQRKANENP